MTPKNKKYPKIALVYDRVNTPYGGAEHVLNAFNQLFPDAPIFTSVYSPEKSKWAKNFKIIPSFLQKISFLREKHQLLAFLMPLAFESHDFSNFDIIISVTSAEAKGVLTKPNQLHICYLLTPTRYLYSHKNSYLKSKKLLQFFPFNQIAKTILKYLTWWDKTTIHRPDVLIPISRLVKQRVNQYYKLESSNVIYPPVDSSARKMSSKKLNYDYFLSLSRLVDYKRVDLSIKAAISLNKILVVVGAGDSKKKLIEVAKENYLQKKQGETLEELFQRAKRNQKVIIFTGKLSESEVNILFSNCRALIMPGEEDFGITGLESGIFGKAVILFYKSGVSELLENKTNAIFIENQTTKSVITAIKKFEQTKFDSTKIIVESLKHDMDSFKKQIKNEIFINWNKFTQNS